MESLSCARRNLSMLTHEEALQKILKHAHPLKPRALPLKECLGLVASQDLFSSEPFPNFDNSAVDGYALSFPSPEKGETEVPFKICGEISAGTVFRRALKPGEALRIFTGAPVPWGAQAVVMQEHTERRKGSLLILKVPSPQENIRFRGEDFQKGRVLVRRKTVLDPTHLALLAAVGHKKASVYPSPQVGILATGNELSKPGEKRKAGKIWDSNTILLELLVKQIGANPHSFPPVGDRAEEIRSRVREGLESDVLIISGGVSVGKYDFVREVLKKEGVHEIFWKVDIKPGKPLFFGEKNSTLVFGLPGNPVSVFVTFEEFVKPALLKMRGANRSPEWIWARMTESFRNGSRLHFVRARCVVKKRGLVVTPLKGQGSHMIGNLASSNALLKVEPHARLKRNQWVLVKKFQSE